MRLLIHSCCGPCLLEPYDVLSVEYDVEVAYANPNIDSPEEYARRRDALLAYARSSGIEVREIEYRPELWRAAVNGVEDVPKRRCAACYALRLRMVAEEAAAEGFDAIATTLTVSPYQDQDAVREAGETAAEKAGVSYVHRDFRSHYRLATQRSRDLGMYRQNYCGCAFSKLEAEASREARGRAREDRKLRRDEWDDSRK